MIGVEDESARAYFVYSLLEYGKVVFLVVKKGSNLYLNQPILICSTPRSYNPSNFNKSA